MTIGGSAEVVQGPLPGWGDNPGLPAGVWAADADVTGDVSGGVRDLTFFFARTGQSNPRFYSLEYLTLIDTLNTAHNAEIITSGMGSLQSGGGGALSATVLTRAGVATARMTPEELLYFKGIFLGRQTARNTPAILTVTETNSDGDFLRVTVGGYVWDSQAMGTGGGIRRPPGPFRS